MEYGPDQEADVAAVQAGDSGEPWQYYDLGRGFCGYTFFGQCPHRMACAKCDFCTPKNSSGALLLEARDNLQRMLTAVPRTDDERVAADDGQAALGQLLDRLADVSTPAGPTPPPDQRPGHRNPPADRRCPAGFTRRL